METMKKNYLQTLNNDEIEIVLMVRHCGPSTLVLQC